jgi:hypothetical protein
MGRAGVGSIPANPDARNVPSFRRWRFEMKLSPFEEVLEWGTGMHCTFLWPYVRRLACPARGRDRV